MTKTLDVTKIPFDYGTMKPQLVQLAIDVNGNPGKYVLGIPAGCAFISLHCKLHLAASVIGRHQHLLKPKCKSMSYPSKQPVRLIPFNMPSHKHHGSRPPPPLILIPKMRKSTPPQGIMQDATCPP